MMQIPYIPNVDADRAAMLKEIGVNHVDALFHDVPVDFYDVPFNLPEPLSEMGVKRELDQFVRRNYSLNHFINFLGAGFYNHFIPSVIGHITGRSEFYTAYTPYQAEVSQGTLQTIYEYQSLICHLTGMQVSNAGMYDGSTAATEAALMACRIKKRKKVAVLTGVNPRYLRVMETYFQNQGIEMLILNEEHGLPDDCACLMVQHPNFYGSFVDLQTLTDRAHQTGALLIAIFDPISLGLLKPPGEYDVDIAVAEGQSLGSPICFGGPALGIFACRKEYMRKMPGRIVGKTVDVDGRDGFVLTLSTREQHIRRERATSNICTNEALVALAATVYLAAMGSTGLRRVAEICYHRAHYAAAQIAQIDGYSLESQEPFFKEFAIRCPRSAKLMNEGLLKAGIIGGLDISDHTGNLLLICVTEMNTKAEIDDLVTHLASLAKD